jgi:UDP-GlcNAc:undecaprenyl-phosphate GlcNAc-1-phosphate transferase
MFFLAALGTTVSVGVLDDRFLLTARIRLIFYFLISALILIIFRDQLSLGIVAGIIITFLIGPGIITSVNMIDGMDGLCSTMSVISLLGFIALNYFAKLDNQTLILISISTILAIMPFLFLNFHPAKVFLGSSGSELLGVTLLALMLISTEGLSISYLPLRVLIIGLPVIDMIRVLYYRARAGRKLIFGDRTHIYDTLLQHGLNQRKVWSIMSLAQIAVVSIAVLLNIYL